MFGQFLRGLLNDDNLSDRKRLAHEIGCYKLAVLALVIDFMICYLVVQMFAMRPSIKYGTLFSVVFLQVSHITYCQTFFIQNKGMSLRDAPPFFANFHKILSFFGQNLTFRKILSFFYKISPASKLLQ